MNQLDLIINYKNMSEKTPENIEATPKLEWGPDLGSVFLSKAQTEIQKLNASLDEGEKPWRLPTKDELVAEYKKIDNTPIGFQRNYYWSGTTPPHDIDAVYIVDMNNCCVDAGNKVVHNYARLVRDAA